MVELDILTLKIDKWYRLGIPQQLLQKLSWLSGDMPVKACIVMEHPGRYRLLDPREAEKDPDVRVIKNKIAAHSYSSNSGAFEFQDDASSTLPLRFISVELKPPPPVWRLTLPKVIAEIMQIQPGHSSIAALFLQNHLELWTLEAVRSSLNTPLTEIL